ncbi:cdc42 effector protein 3-like [Centroberyx affinis]|uniref:cdc42 effector protein 3-like n=1 Tax=Centroberyx affinis TaxID=166261 RepID=UPI003A5B99F4
MPLKTASYLKSATMRLSRKPKRRGDLLSVNMISLPLGDFRHLSHIGLDARGDARGDAFGDLSAFQRGGGLVLHGSQSHQDLFLTATSDLTPPPPPKPPRLLVSEGPGAPDALSRPGTLRTAGHKKCHSLPLLDSAEEEKVPQVQQEVPQVQQEVPQVQQEVQVGEEEEEGGLRMRTEVLERDVASDPDPAPAVEEEPSFVLNLDLGPSLLEEVLQVMDRIQSQGTPS